MQQHVTPRDRDDAQLPNCIKVLPSALPAARDTHAICDLLTVCKSARVSGQSGPDVQTAKAPNTLDGTKIIPGGGLEIYLPSISTWTAGDEHRETAFARRLLQEGGAGGADGWSVDGRWMVDWWLIDGRTFARPKPL